jgi:hypothetical protein
MHAQANVLMQTAFCGGWTKFGSFRVLHRPGTLPVALMFVPMKSPASMRN